MAPITIFGIKNCDTMQKAFRWLDEHNIAYEFHDYKKAGIEESEVKKWLSDLSMEDIINKKGTTWKKCTDVEKESVSNQKNAIELIIKNPSLVKRPLVQRGDTHLIGFKESDWEIFFNIR
ncbi:MAG: Spx/MgsR family RNA polymerase-binding regulatory protein [Cytophaga sp.]|uniref:Spx/MgsR family RNA polymerase-binding regulatory protein n=1 Tax=Cytophaga sp. TaxID=29535 RepID=UPI003F7D6C31